MFVSSATKIVVKHFPTTKKPIAMRTIAAPAKLMLQKKTVARLTSRKRTVPGQAHGHVSITTLTTI